MNNETIFEGNQFVISYELLQLLQWLVDNEPESLRELVSLAMKYGLYEKELISSQENVMCEAHSTELQQSIVDFFTLLETYINEAPDSSDSNEPSRMLAKQTMMPAIDQIDCSICDESIVAASVAQATSQLQSNSNENAKELLYKELLKNWNPANKLLLN